MKKCIRGLAITTCALLITGSVGITSACSKKQEDLYILMLVNNQEDAFYKDYFADLEEELGVSIVYEGMSYSDYDIKLSTAMQDRAPDIFYVRPGDIKSYVKDGLLADLSGYLKSEEFTTEVDLSRIYSHVIDVYRYDGKNVSVSDENAPIYGINQGLSYQGLGYNKRLVERKATEIKSAGLCLPWELGEEGNNVSYTFEEFSKLLSIVKDTTGGGLNGTSEIYGMNLPSEIMPLVWAQGGDVVSNGTITINTDAFKTVMQWLRENYKEGNISNAATWGEWSVNQVAFFTEVASWEVSGYISSDLAFDMMPWPSKNGDGEWYGQIGTAAYGVYSGSPNKELAMKVAAGFLREDVQEELVRKGISLPMYKATAEGGYLTDNETYKPEHRSIFIDVISKRNGKFSPINNTFNKEWYDEFKNSIAGYVSKTLGKDETEESYLTKYLTETQSDMQALYNAKNK